MFFFSDLVGLFGWWESVGKENWLKKKKKKVETDLLQNGTLGLVALFYGELLIGYYLCFYELNSNETL